MHHIPESFAWPSRDNFQMVVSKTNMILKRASEIVAFVQMNGHSPENQLFILRTSGPKSKPNLEENDDTVISGRVEVS